eukprot:m51a1_g2736 hypothetical protein (505) ;mRNA; f:900622-902290
MEGSTADDLSAAQHSVCASQRVPEPEPDNAALEDAIAALGEMRAQARVTKIAPGSGKKGLSRSEPSSPVLAASKAGAQHLAWSLRRPRTTDDLLVSPSRHRASLPLHPWSLRRLKKRGSPFAEGAPSGASSSSSPSKRSRASGAAEYGRPYVHRREDNEVRQQKDLVDAVQAAAQAISTSDVLLYATGAGDSANSGLKVYNEVSDIPAYTRAGLAYRDICNPRWVHDDPELFYGFWGHCFNLYRDTRPHAGNDIVCSWRDRRFGEDPEFARRWAEAAGQGARVGTARFFCLTSNVDRHSLASGVARGTGELREIHGSLERWQCAAPGECRRPGATWPAPKGFRFNVDEETMRAPEGWPLQTAAEETFGWETNWPRCPHCLGPARPAVLMFDDFDWIDPVDAENKTCYKGWREAVRTHLKLHPTSRVVIIEIGCGTRVQTIRMMTEELLEKTAAGRCSLVRINPDPSDCKYRGFNMGNVHLIRADGLWTLRAIDELMRSAQPQAQ